MNIGEVQEYLDEKTTSVIYRIAQKISKKIRRSGK
jgi:hypothetical protein